MKYFWFVFGVITSTIFCRPRPMTGWELRARMQELNPPTDMVERLRYFGGV